MFYNESKNAFQRILGTLVLMFAFVWIAGCSTQSFIGANDEPAQAPAADSMEEEAMPMAMEEEAMPMAMEEEAMPMVEADVEGADSMASMQEVAAAPPAMADNMDSMMDDTGMMDTDMMDTDMMNMDDDMMMEDDSDMAMASDGDMGMMDDTSMMDMDDDDDSDGLGWWWLLIILAIAGGGYGIYRSRQ